MRFNTGNAVEPNGSSDPEDLYDNAAIGDLLINGPLAEYLGRLGVPLKSWRGIMQQVVDYLAAQGYETVFLSYGAGVNIERQMQLVQRDGELYRIKDVDDLPLELTGTWAEDSEKLVAVGDAALRQQLSTNGAAMNGYSGRTVKDRLDDEINIQDVWASQGGGTSWSDALSVAIDMASFDINSSQRSGMAIRLPGGNDYDFSDIVVKSGIVIKGDGPKNTRVYCTKPNGTIFTQSTSDRTDGEYKSIGFEGILFDGGVGTSGASRIAATAVNIGGMHHSWMKDCQLQRFNSKAVLDGDANVVDFLFDNILARENEFAFHAFNPYSTCLTFRNVYAVGNLVNWRMENIGEVEWWSCKNEKAGAEGIGIYGASCIARLSGGYSEDNGLTGQRCQILVNDGASVGIRDHYMKYNANTGENLAHIIVNACQRTLIDGITFNSDPGAVGFDISADSSTVRNIFLGENHHIGVMARLSPLAEARAYGANHRVVRGPAPSLLFQDANGSSRASIASPSVNQIDFLNGIGGSLGTFKATGFELGGTWDGPHLNMGGFHIWAGTSKLRIKFGAPTSIDDGAGFVTS